MTPGQSDEVISDERNVILKCYNYVCKRINEISTFYSLVSTIWEKTSSRLISTKQIAIFIVWATSYLLLGRTRSRGRCRAAIQLYRHPEPSGHALHGVVDELDSGGQHGRRSVPLRHSHKPQKDIPHVRKQQRKRPTPVWRRLSWTYVVLGQNHFGRVPVSGMNVRSLVVFSTATHSIGDPPRAPHVCCCQMSRWVVRRTQMGISTWDDVHSHLVSAEWRCPGSTAQCARDSVAPLRRSSAGWMPASTGMLSTGVRRRHPVTLCEASLMAGSMRRDWALTPGRSAVLCCWMDHG